MRKIVLALVVSTLSLGGWAEPQGAPGVKEAPKATVRQISDRQQPSAPVVQNTQERSQADSALAQPPAEKTETQAPRPETPRKPKPPLEIKWIDF